MPRPRSNRIKPLCTPDHRPQSVVRRIANDEFACRTHFFSSLLERCTGGPEHIARHVLALSTYLGHAHVADTYWYLQATPHLMTGIADAYEAFFDGGMP